MERLDPSDHKFLNQLAPLVDGAVEHLLINKVVEIARAENANKIIGKFIPTEKNIIVKDLYEELGFKNGVLDIIHFQAFETAIKLS